MNINPNLNGRIVRRNGSTYSLTVHSLGGRILAQATCIFGPDKGAEVNLQTGRSPLARDLRNAINLNLVS